MGRSVFYLLIFFYKGRSFWTRDETSLRAPKPGQVTSTEILEYKSGSRESFVQQDVTAFFKGHFFSFFKTLDKSITVSRVAPLRSGLDPFDIFPSAQRLSLTRDAHVLVRVVADRWLLLCFFHVRSHSWLRLLPLLSQRRTNWLTGRESTSCLVVLPSSLVASAEEEQEVAQNHFPTIKIV